MKAIVLSYRNKMWRLTSGFDTLHESVDPVECIHRAKELEEDGFPLSNSAREGIARMALGQPINGWAFSARGAAVLDLKYVLPLISAEGEARGRKHEAKA